MNIRLQKNEIMIDDETFCISDLDSPEIENHMLNNIDDYRFDCDVVDEVFIKYGHAITFLKKKIQNFEKISIIASYDANPFLKNILYDSIEKKKSLLHIISFKIISVFNIFIATLYMFLLLLFKPFYKGTNISDYDGFFVSRSKADIKMIKVLENKNIFGFFDNFKDKRSVFLSLKRKTRLLFLIKAFVNSFKALRKIYKNVSTCYGAYCGIDSLRFYSKRITHSLLFEYTVSFFLYNSEATFYTADNIDRFALIEERLCRQNKIKIVCIPHGIEYGFILPHCFVGDYFYCTSYFAASYLNNLYKTNKFIYSEDVCKKMFSVNAEQSNKKLVYFSEPREPFVNIMIIKELSKYQSEKILLKLHPADKKNDYIEIDNLVSFIDDFNEAISNSICVARKSTVLVEALYNNSVPVAVLINNKDINIFNTFPSLQDERIIKIYNLNNLNIIFNKGVM